MRPVVMGLLIFERLRNGNLRIAPTAEGMQEAKDLLADEDKSPDGRLHDMLDFALCNGWLEVPPEKVGALTDAPIISEDFTVDDDGDYVPVAPEARVYAFMNYAVEDPVETWAKGIATIWTGAPVERKAT